MNTIVLRFKNLPPHEGEPAVNTIEEHRNVLAQKKRVWWGWWKKEHEPDRTDELRTLRTKLPKAIGLVNRPAKRYYSATCTNINESGGKLLPSPASTLTPMYYSTGKLCAAWFTFTAINQLSEEDFKEKFGDIPYGDPTLAIVEQTAAGSKLIQPSLHINTKPVQVKGNSILHISDLHFGSDHRYPLQDKEGPIDKKSLASILSTYLTTLQCSIGVVVVSGDFISRGEERGFESALTFLHALGRKLNLDKEQFVLVPGNHDIKIVPGEADFATFSHERPFRVFVAEFYDVRIQEDLESLRVFTTRSGWTLRFLGLNSVRPRDEKTMNYGYIGGQRYDAHLRILKQANRSVDRKKLIQQSKTVNLAVFHHHLKAVSAVSDPEVEYPISVVLDAGQIEEDFLNNGIHFVLHGHQHIPYIGTSGGYILRGSKKDITHAEKVLRILGAGSAGAGPARLSPQFPHNAFSVYTPTSTGLKVHVEQFSQAGSWKYRSGTMAYPL